MDNFCRVTVSLPASTVEALKKIADRNHSSLSAVMRDASDMYMSSDYFDANQNAFLKIIRDEIQNSHKSYLNPCLEKQNRKIAYNTKLTTTLLIAVAALMSEIYNNGTEYEAIIVKALMLADKYDGSTIKPDEYYIKEAKRLTHIEDDIGLENP